MTADPHPLPDDAPPPGRYRHYKGGAYTVLGAGRHSETEEWLVIYRAERDGGLWLRPLAEWNRPVAQNDGAAPRFAPVTADRDAD